MEAMGDLATDHNAVQVWCVGLLQGAHVCGVCCDAGGFCFYKREAMQ